jgi:hypothetical protein
MFWPGGGRKWRTFQETLSTKGGAPMRGLQMTAEWRHEFDIVWATRKVAAALL